MKNLIGIIALLLIGVAAYFLLLEDNSSKPKNTAVFKDFSIEDTAAVSQIFMSQPNGKKILLTREKEGFWMVNNKFEARRDAIKLILKTLHDIQVAGPVPQKDFDGVVKRMATRSTKVEYYTGDDQPEKVWYIGDATDNKHGTNMLLEKDNIRSAKPFITHMLMERGYLSSRFFLDTLLWKERIVMKAKPQDIKSIEVIHRYDTATSFRIDQIADSKFIMTNLAINQSNELPSSIAIPYFKEFETIYYEYIDVNTPRNEFDSIYASIPRHTVNIQTVKGEKIQLKAFNMPVREGATLGDRLLTYNPERMYLYSSYMDPNMHPVVQNLTFDLVVPPLEKFESSTTVEK